MNSDFYDIPGYDQWRTCELVDKGWSDDIKFYIETKISDQLLLRVSDASVFERKADEYEILQRLMKLNLPLSKPLDFGYCHDKAQVYTLLTWMPGDDAEVNLPKLTPEEQYELGVEAGIILKKLHGIKAPETWPEWSSMFNKKIDRHIKRYLDCPHQVDGLEHAIDYLNANRAILVNRPLSFHHGDYHCGNMTLTECGHLGIIDFNRFDYGDPWEEFNRIVWDVALSHEFANGRIHGYFDGDPPALFFQLLAMYIASNALAAIPWSISFGQQEIDVMRQQAKDVLGWYDNYKTYYPSWYRAINR